MSFIRCTKCGECFENEKQAKEHKCIPQIQDLIRRTTAPFRRPRKLGERRSRQEGQISDAIELSYLRGYQAGYGDKKKGKPAKPYG